MLRSGLFLFHLGFVSLLAANLLINPAEAKEKVYRLQGLAIDCSGTTERPSAWGLKKFRGFSYRIKDLPGGLGQKVTAIDKNGCFFVLEAENVTVFSVDEDPEPVFYEETDEGVVTYLSPFLGEIEREIVSRAYKTCDVSLSDGKQTAPSAERANCRFKAVVDLVGETASIGISSRPIPGCLSPALRVHIFEGIFRQITLGCDGDLRTLIEIGKS